MAEKVTRGITLVNHPKKDWFDGLVAKGLTVTEIDNLQREKLEPQYQVGKKTLREYIKNFLNLDKRALSKARQMHKGEITAYNDEQRRQKALEGVVENPAITQKIEQEAIRSIDTMKTMEYLHDTLLDRIQILIDMDDGSYRKELAIGEIIDKLRLLLGDYSKLNGKVSNEGTNIQINMVKFEESQKESKAVKDAVLEILKEFNPEFIPIFMQKLRNKMKESVSEVFSDMPNTNMLPEGKYIKDVNKIVDKTEKIKSQIEDLL